MTMIKFNYNDSYGQPSRGSLAFMPHRRHAANETEILPKPFTVPLLNGEAQVNLQPNSSSWVWIITEYFENVAKSFYTTIPDRDGIIEHTELVHISPSSIPAAYDAVEPAWWAEMRQYKQTVGETLLKSGEALTEAQEAIETGRNSVEQTRNNASLAKAYSEQSRDHSYTAKEHRDQAKIWRDEAQEQADRAATGPESAAARSEAAATRSETARDRAIAAEDESRNSAAEARLSETNAGTHASTASTHATTATTQADRAKSEADRAQGYADELLDGPRDYAEAAETARDEAQAFAATAENNAQHAEQQATISQNAATSSQDVLSQVESYVDQVAEHGEWTEPTFQNGFTAQSEFPVKYRILSNGMTQIIGRARDGNDRNIGTVIIDGLPNNLTEDMFVATWSINGKMMGLTITPTGQIKFTSGSANNFTEPFHFNHIIP